MLNQYFLATQVFTHRHSTARPFENNVNSYRRFVQVFVKHSHVVPIWRQVAANHHIKISRETCDRNLCHQLIANTSNWPTHQPFFRTTFSMAESGARCN